MPKPVIAREAKPIRFELGARRARRRTEIIVDDTGGKEGLAIHRRSVSTRGPATRTAGRLTYS